MHAFYAYTFLFVRERALTRSLLETFIHSFAMDESRAHEPHSAAAQGAQASEPRGADRPIFTGLSPSVPAPEDAARHGSVHGHHPAQAGHQPAGTGPAVFSLPQHNPCAYTPPHAAQWSHPTGAYSAGYSMHGAYVPYQQTAVHGGAPSAFPHVMPSPVPFNGGAAASWQHPSVFQQSSAYTTPSQYQQYNQQLATEQRERAEAQQQLQQCQQAMAAMEHQLATMSAASVKQHQKQKRAARRNVSPPPSSEHRLHRTSGRRTWHC